METEFELKAQERGKGKVSREKGLIPAVLYGPKIQNINLVIEEKEFNKIFKKAGESSLISLSIRGREKPFIVLIHDFQRDPISYKITHVDFYQPDLKKEVEAWVPIVITGKSRAVKQLGGTLVKNVSEILVRALPFKLPHKIEVDVSKLNTFDDEILVKDLVVGEGVKLLKDPNDVLVSVSPPEKVEEELAAPVEEGAEEVEVIQEKEKEKSEEEGSKEETKS